MEKVYPTWYEAWKDVTHKYEEYDPPVAKEKEKDEKVSTGKRSKRSSKVSD